MEPPHVTIYHRSRRWRLALRGGEVLAPDPDPAEVPRDLVSVVREQFPILRVECDQMYPRNPVSSKESVHE